METTDRRKWRLIIDESPRSGAWNMALDRALMESTGDQRSWPALRIYQWQPAAITLGKGQHFDVVDVVACLQDGVDVVHRPTGGWAILHCDEMTYSVASHSDEPAVAGALMAAYNAISEALIAGLHLLNIPATQAPPPSAEDKKGLVACFAVPYNNEITAHGKKIMGSAQARPQRKLLQHGSLPLTGDVSRVVNYLRFDDESERDVLRDHLRSHAITASEAAGRPVTYAMAAQAIAGGFMAKMPILLEKSDYTNAEMTRAAELAELLTQEWRQISGQVS